MSTPTPTYERPSVSNTDENGDQASSTAAENAASDRPEGQEPPPPPPGPIELAFRDMNGFQLSFKLKRNTKMKKAMDAFSARSERDRNSLRFLFEGQRVLDDHTAESFDMQDGDVVDVHTQQLGGG